MFVSALWCSEICKTILFHNAEHHASPAFSLLHLNYIYNVLALSASYGLPLMVGFE